MEVIYKQFGETKIETIDNFYNATYILSYYNDKTGNKKRMYDYLKAPKTREYMKFVSSTAKTDLTFNTQGTGACTFMHELLFMHFVGWFKDDELNGWTEDWSTINVIKPDSKEHRQMKIAYKEYPGYNPSMFYTDSLLIRKVCKHDGRLEDVDYVGLLADTYLLNSILLKAKMSIDDRHTMLSNHAAAFWLIKDENMRLGSMAY